jgi:hypothetical protein
MFRGPRAREEGGVVTGFGAVTERPADGGPGVAHPGWARRFPWLVQGTTRRDLAGAPFDLALFGAGATPAAVHRAWERLRATAGLGRALHARQVHGAAVRWHEGGPPGLFLPEPCDGHATDRRDLLLTVTVADCVPVFVVDPDRRAVALLHAGWRGAAAGILERGLEVLAERVGSGAGEVHVHLGPSICGSCYEVGPEVFASLGLPAPPGPRPLDLRAALARRAVEAGADPSRVSTSTHCTRCGDGFFSHRGGDAGRQVGYLGIRA